MTLHTLIARVDDGFPLAASTDNARANLEDQKQQAKRIVKLMTSSSPSEMSISSGRHYFMYIIKQGVCFLTLCENQYPKKLAVGFLNEIATEFLNLYSSQIDTVNRPYQFISSVNHFDKFIEQTKKLYTDTRTQQNLQRLQDGLHDVQGIMSRNITEVLERGTKLEGESSSYLLAPPPLLCFRVAESFLALAPDVCVPYDAVAQTCRRSRSCLALRRTSSGSRRQNLSSWH